MAPTSQPAAKRGAPRGQRPMSTNAARAVDDATASLITISGKAESINRQSDRIDRWADQGIEALQLGNAFVAEQMLLDIRNATATQRHAAVDIKTTAGDARAALGAVSGRLTASRFASRSNSRPSAATRASKRSPTRWFQITGLNPPLTVT